MKNALWPGCIHISKNPLRSFGIENRKPSGHLGPDVVYREVIVQYEELVTSGCHIDLWTECTLHRFSQGNSGEFVYPEVLPGFVSIPETSGLYRCSLGTTSSIGAEFYHCNNQSISGH